MLAPLAAATHDGAGICAPRAQLIAHLAKGYQEVPVARAVSTNGYLFEVLRSRGGETFSLIITPPGGFTCLIGSGTDWEDIPFVAPSTEAS